MNRGPQTLGAVLTQLSGAGKDDEPDLSIT